MYYVDYYRVSVFPCHSGGATLDSSDKYRFRWLARFDAWLFNKLPRLTINGYWFFAEFREKTK